jgi:hypothetical protein
VEEPPVNPEHVEHRPHVTPGVRHNLLGRQNRHFEETVGRKKNERVVEDDGTQATPLGSTVVDQGNGTTLAVIYMLFASAIVMTSVTVVLI